MIEYAYVEKQMYAEALADHARIRNPDTSPQTIANLVYIYGRSGQLEKARASARRLQNQKGNQIDPSPEIYTAIGLGDKERAFAGFGVALIQHSNVLTTLKVNPLYDPLRSDPRFDELMRRLGFSH
jgi:hypothetical protein